jgi:hypothetical protein
MPAPMMAETSVLDINVQRLDFTVAPLQIMDPQAFVRLTRFSQPRRSFRSKNHFRAGNLESSRRADSRKSTAFTLA